MGYRGSGRGSRLVAGTAALAALGAALTLSASAQAAPSDATRYTLANGCFALSSSGGGVSGAGPYRMKATTLGVYLLYTANRRYLGQASGPAPLGGGVENAAQPSPATEWKVRPAGGGGYTLANRDSGEKLTASGGELDLGGSGAATIFSFDDANGCPRYPEAKVNAKGSPLTSSPAYGETRGYVDGHMHHMAFEFLGGEAHCGQPWHRYGAPFALQDCNDHQPNGCAAILEVAIGGDPCHDPRGWPDFPYWPRYNSLTHEQSYYKWVERAWKGGLRIFVTLMVENRVLCELYPIDAQDKNSCNEMDSVLLQLKRVRQLERYIDAQAGGPGKGFYRIVTNPFEARKVINQGKLAVVLGMEVSEPFNCLRKNGEPQCDLPQIDRWIQILKDRGVRQMELINKFDNALAGVAGDNGETGVLTNTGNFYATGQFWDLETCVDPDNTDKSPTAIEAHNEDTLVGNAIEQLLPPGAAPVYPEEPHCNRLNLSRRGEHAIVEMADKGMMFDPDHMGVYARRQALSLIEAIGHPGVLSSHSWSTQEAYETIARLGGVITPYAGGSEGFVDKWIEAKRLREGRQYWGIGWGADQNGFGGQGGPRGADVANPVTYPFRSFDGGVKLGRQRSGNRVFDINTDGVAHYGLYPDWVEDLRQLAGERIVRDLSKGAEAYLQMWERSVGIEEVRCRVWVGDLLERRGGIDGRLRLGDRPIQVLRRTGQPVDRKRAWTWCARGPKPQPRFVSRNRRVSAVFEAGSKRVGLIASSIRRTSAGGINRRDLIRNLPRSARRAGPGLYVRNISGDRVLFYGARAGRVSFVGIASAKVARTRASLRRHLRRTGMI